MKAIKKATSITVLSVMVLALSGMFPQVLNAETLRSVSTSSDGTTKSPVVVRLTQRKVVHDARGAEQLVEVKTVKPGDVLEYRATYINTGKEPVKKLVAQLPLPQGLEYIPKSAKPVGAMATFAEETGTFSAEPLMRKLSNGKVELVPYKYYRQVHWAVARLDAGAEVVVSVRAKVDATPLQQIVTDGATESLTVNQVSKPK